MASISSMKMMERERLWASSKMLRRRSSLSPVELSDDLGAGDVGEPCVGLVRHGPGDDGLARAGRAVEEHPLGRLDPEPFEHLRKSQGQLDHLAHPADLEPQPADVLVGDFAGLSDLCGFEPVQVRGLAHDHRAPGGRLGDQEVADSGPEEVQADAVPCRQGLPLQQGQDVGRVPLLIRQGPRGEGLQGDASGEVVCRRPHVYGILQRHEGVLARQSVDLQHVLRAVLLARPHPGRRDLLPHNFDDLPLRQAQYVHVRGVHAGDALQGVAGTRLLHRKHVSIAPSCPSFRPRKSAVRQIDVYPDAYRSVSKGKRRPNRRFPKWPRSSRGPERSRNDSRVLRARAGSRAALLRSRGPPSASERWRRGRPCAGRRP